MQRREFLCPLMPSLPWEMLLWPLALNSPFWFFAGRGRVGNPWQMTKNKPQHAAFFFFLLPILILSSSPWQYQEIVSNSCLRKTGSYSRFLVMKSFCAWIIPDPPSIESSDLVREMKTKKRWSLDCSFTTSGDKDNFFSQIFAVAEWETWEWVRVPEYAVT